MVFECSKPKYCTHVWTQNNAIVMLSSNRKIIIINVLCSIWKQYKIEIGQFGTEDIRIRLTQFMCLMFLLKSWNFSVKEPNETSMALDIAEKVNVMPKLCSNFDTFRPVVLIWHLNATKHIIDKGYVSFCTYVVQYRIPNKHFRIECVGKPKTIRSPKIIETFFAFKCFKHY